MKYFKSLIIALLFLWLVIVPTAVFYRVQSLTQPTSNQVSQDPIVPSQPSNVVIRESAAYDAPIGNNRPIVHLSGVIYWTELAGQGLNFFTNTSDVIDAKFYDYETGAPMDQLSSCQGAYQLISNCVQDQGDRYLIIPAGRSFAYEIKSYYNPDIVQDTGFIVIFNSQSVDFSLTVDGVQKYAAVDYSNEIILPQGAGLVSWAPIDSGFVKLDKTPQNRFKLSWNYVNRAMDTKHNPLMIAVTYTYDAIFLAFQNRSIKINRKSNVNNKN